MVDAAVPGGVRRWGELKTVADPSLALVVASGVPIDVDRALVLLGPMLMRESA